MHVGARGRGHNGAEGVPWAEEVARHRCDRDLRHQAFLRGAEKLTKPCQAPSGMEWAWKERKAVLLHPE